MSNLVIGNTRWEAVRKVVSTSITLILVRDQSLEIRGRRRRWRRERERGKDALLAFPLISGFRPSFVALCESSVVKLLLPAADLVLDLR